MKIFRNLVPKEVLDQCNAEIDNLLPTQRWSSSHTTWGSSLYDGVPGMCMRAVPTFKLVKVIKDAIIDSIPSCNNLNMNYHYWLKYSGIGWHNDSARTSGDRRVFGATIYLNEWDHKWGGLFVWQDGKDGSLKVVCPEPGTLVLNTEAEDHHVTMISPSAKYARRSIQIWGDQ
tara:strand:- start:1859 stop:2377 length:519 start_codon:yes stop_codon:yes gene_type:complete